MFPQDQTTAFRPDPAAVFSCALSLWKAANARARSDRSLNLSETYNGMDQFMRELMRIANQFEEWACEHLSLDKFTEVWPYLLEDKFGKTCLDLISPIALAEFGESHCLRVALQLRLPIILDGKLPVPFDLTLQNPIIGSGFREFRIQTVRDSLENGNVVPFVAGDEPFDAEFSSPYFAVYGVVATRGLEHIADRNNYGSAIALLQNLAPGIIAPINATFS